MDGVSLRRQIQSPIVSRITSMFRIVEATVKLEEQEVNNLQLPKTPIHQKPQSITKDREAML